MADRSRQMGDRGMSAVDQPVERAGFTVRVAEGSDVASIAELEKVAFTDAWSADDFAQLADSRRSIFLVALDAAGGTLLGYVIVASVLDEAEVLNLAVAPACRRLGLGGMLLDAALSKAAAAGATSVYLEVRESNGAARSLYESRGFTEIARRRQYYRKPVEDALVLRGAVQR